MSADSAHFATDFKPEGTKVKVPVQILSDMQAHASSTYPEECCGLMLGTFENGIMEKIVRKSIRMDNVFVKEERFHRYTIDPKEFLLAESDAEKQGLEIVGIYHSHPNAPAKPSEFDTRHAWPTMSYVVMSVRNAQTEDTKSWVLKDDRTGFVSEELSIEK
jgi:proteasome lid subunit RPN8/RPN11